MTRYLGMVLAAAVALAPAQAIAQPLSPQKEAAAQALFDEARALTGAGKHAEACPKFEESQRLDPSIGTQYYLADCLEAIGRTASAWTLYLQVGDLAEAARQSARAKHARERANRIEPSLVRLAIRIPEALRAAPDLRVERDDALVAAAQWGAAVPVDPGRHRVVVTASGKEPWRREVDARSPGATVVVDVPLLKGAVEAPAPPVSSSAARPSAVSATRRAPPAPADADNARGSTQRVLGLVVGGVGLAAAGVGAGFGAHAIAKHSASSGHCDADDFCDPDGLKFRGEALDAARVATIAFVGAGVALTGGAILFFAAPSSDSAPRAPVRVSLGPLGARLEGRF